MLRKNEIFYQLKLKNKMNYDKISNNKRKNNNKFKEYKVNLLF